MVTFMTFGAGFLMRPLGAIILGAYIDRVGRRKGLIVTLGLMAVGTVLIAFVPGYATIGILAPAAGAAGAAVPGLLRRGGTGRRVGLPLGNGHPRPQGLLRGWQSASQQVAIIVAAVIGYCLNSGWPRPPSPPGAGGSPSSSAA